jgi:hypothetical protein
MNATVVSPFTMARGTARMSPSVIREILKITERSGIILLAGGLPSADTFRSRRCAIDVEDSARSSRIDDPAGRGVGHGRASDGREGAVSVRGAKPDPAGRIVRCGAR